MSTRRPDARTLIAFALVVIIGGTNFVAVRLSNRELPPFFGAGVRFVAASVLLFAIAALTKVGLPRGRALTGAIVFGVLNFFAAYAFMYWALQRAPAALAGVVFGMVPLLTFVLAVAQRLERFRWRALFGAAIAIAGVALMLGAPANADVPVIRVGAILLAAVGAAQATVVVKRFPPVHPFAMNAVAMGVGAPALLVLSLLVGERWSIPDSATTWYTLAFLIPVGSVGLFILAVFVIQRWTASAASYQFVLFPVVSAIMGALIAGEALSSSLAFGGVLVVAGTFVGALASAPRADAPNAAAAPVRPA